MTKHGTLRRVAVWGDLDSQGQQSRIKTFKDTSHIHWSWKAGAALLAALVKAYTDCSELGIRVEGPSWTEHSAKSLSVLLTRARLKDVLNMQVPVLIETKLKMHIPQGLQCKVSHLLSDSSSAGRIFLHMVCRKAMQAVVWSWQDQWRII